MKLVKMKMNVILVAGFISLLLACNQQNQAVTKEKRNADKTFNSSKIKMTICECENLFFDYQEKKEKAKTQKEKNRLSIEELSKNMECYKLESSLGDKLEEEQAKCN